MTTDPQEKNQLSKLLKWGVLIGSLGFLALMVLTPSPSDTIDPKTCSRSDAWLYAQQAVKAQLKNPDEADFHNPLSWEVESDPTVAGQVIVKGQVTATNSFNAKIKSNFSAVVRCDKGTWYTGRVVME